MYNMTKLDLSDDLKEAVEEYKKTCDMLVFFSSLNPERAKYKGDSYVRAVAAYLRDLRSARKSELWKVASKEGVNAFMAEVITAWVERESNCRDERTWKEDLKWSRRMLTPMRLKFDRTFPGHEELLEKLQGQMPTPFDENFCVKVSNEVSAHLEKLFPRVEWFITTTELVAYHMLEVSTEPFLTMSLGIALEYGEPDTRGMVSAIAKVGDTFFTESAPTELEAAVALVSRLVQL